MTEYERITDAPGHDRARVSHEARYKLAAQFTTDTDIVLDAACGTGYGQRFLRGHYMGADKEPFGQKYVVDLQTWKPDTGFDVAVSFETIEHLPDYTQFVRTLKLARGWIVMSTPIVPTKDRNIFHVHDFTADEVKALFVDDDWRLHAEYHQRGVYGVFVFARKVEDWTPTLVWSE